MFLWYPDRLRKWHRIGRRWLGLAAGLLLTLSGAGYAKPVSADETGVSTTTTPSALSEVARHEGESTPGADNAELKGTVLSSHAAGTRTIITDSRGRQQVYAIGDEIPDGGEVVEIHRDYVIVRHNGRLQRLDFAWTGASGSVDQSMPAHAASAENHHRLVLRHEMLSQPGLLLELVGAAAVIEDGHFRGYRVTQPEDPAFLKSLGLKPGDMLTAVNGVPLDTPDYGTRVLEAMAGNGELTFTIQRGSQVLVVGE